MRIAETDAAATGDAGYVPTQESSKPIMTGGNRVGVDNLLAKRLFAGIIG